MILYKYISKRIEMSSEAPVCRHIIIHYHYYYKTFKIKLLQRQNNTLSGYHQPDSLPVSVRCDPCSRSLCEAGLLFASRSASSFTSVSDFLEVFKRPRRKDVDLIVLCLGWRNVRPHRGSWFISRVCRNSLFLLFLQFSPVSRL